ncbi:MAG TPA: DUF177 domain-containing protein [Caulobacteraceae bacterium]|nr:DUF177 domain-containing protein [Caulobacteraceae bacterium]
MSETASLWPEGVRLDEAARGRPDTPFRRHLVADDKTRAAIGEALDLVSLERLEADLTVRGWFDGVVLEGRWSAEIVQICGVELEPFSTVLEGEFSIRIVPQGSIHAPDPDEDLALDLEADDPPDVLDGDVIGLGDYVVEHLALEIDPFPRRPGAVFEPPAPTSETSPFAALKALKPRGGDQ